MRFATLTAAASLLVGVLAAEGIHLVNCGDNYYSLVVYCADDSNCDFYPSAANECPIEVDGADTWEGSEQSCTFETGVVFSWDIEADAQSFGDYTDVGTGSNGFTTFNIFKDDQHEMFTDPNGNACYSIYYCLDA